MGLIDAAPGAIARLVEHGHDLIRVLTPIDRSPIALRIFDPDQIATTADALVVAVGLDAVGATAAVPLLAEAGAAGLVVKPEATSDELITAVNEHHLGLLVLRAGVGWDDALQLLRTSISDENDQALTDLMQQPGGLAELARTVGRRIGRPVTIEDAMGQVLAYSAQGEHVDRARQDTILQGASPADVLRKMRRDGVFRRLDTSAEPVWFSDPEAGVDGRQGMRIVDGDRVIGYLWVVDPDQSLSTESLRLITQTAHLASFYLVRDRLEASFANRIRDDLVRDVVQREVVSPALITARAHSVGLVATAGYEVLLADLDGFEEQAMPGEERAQALKRALLDRVTAEARDVSADAVTVAIGDAVLVLLPRSTREPRAAELATRLVRSCGERKPELAVSVGIGSPVAGLAELADSYDRAGLAVRVAQTALGGRSVADHATLGAYLLLLPDGTADAVLSEPVRLLVDYDAKHGTDYAATLEVFLDSFGNRSASATRLHVHLNTLVYRLRRIEEMSGFDVNDSEARLAAQLELRRMRLAGWRPLPPSSGSAPAGVE